VDALAFVQLIEAALHGTSMKEPLLSAVVANEPKSPVPNESLDSAGRHPSLLGRAQCPKKSRFQYSFQQSLVTYTDFMAEYLSSSATDHEN
jgi:hypothetical protein